MRILFVASEGLPFSKTGGLADVVEALPKALVARGHEVAVVLPRYRGTKTSTIVMPSLTVPLGLRLRFPAVADGTLLNGVRYFFVDDPAYFDRDGIYGTSTGDFWDNAERFSEFSRAAIEIAKHIWPADVIHCHDWQTALVPVLLRTSYGDDPMMKDIPVVFTIHNMGYQGQFSRDVLERAGIPAITFTPSRLEFYGDPDIPGRPVVGIVSRFADQKGFDLIAEVAPEIMREDMALVVLGTGDKKYEKLFQTLAIAYPDRVGAKIAYDNAIAHKVEAGSDMFLMPSRYEPCGLNQIYSLKYGTVPIVRATGGLDDTIELFDLEHGTGTGFKFWDYTGGALLYTIRQALHHFADERIWKRIQLNGMEKDFSWKTPAAEYVKLYGAARTARGLGQPARNQMPVATSN